jgi:hypothetical protein
VIRTAIIVATAALVSACASSHVIVGKVRPPILPDQVKIYLSPPKAYEQVAIIDASSRSSWALTDQQKMNKAIERLKQEAASLGANGILLQGVGDQSAGSVGTGFGTATASGHTAYGTAFGVSGNIFIKAANGVAIYVTEE